MAEDMKDMQAILDEVLASITNPNSSPKEKFEDARRNMIAMGLTADKHCIMVREVWEIVKKLEDAPGMPFEQPDEIKTREERIFWDFIAEWDLLPKGG